MRKFIRFVAFIFIGIALLCASAWVYLNSAYAKSWIVKSTTEAFREALGYQLSIGNVSFSLPLQLTFYDTLIGEDDSPGLKARQIIFQASFSALWKQHVLISSLEFIDVTFPNPSKYEYNLSNNPLLSKLDITQLSNPLSFQINAQFSLSNLQKYFQKFSPLDSDTEAFQGDLLIKWGKKISFQGSYVVDTKHNLNISLNEGYVGPLNIHGKIHLSRQLNLDKTSLWIEASNLSFLEQWTGDHIKGRAIARCLLTGNIEDLAVNTFFTTEKISLHSIFIPQAEGHFIVRRQADEILGDVVVNAIVNQIEVKAHSDFVYRKEGLVFSDILVESLQDQVSGYISFDDDGNLNESLISGKIQEISRFNQWLPVDLKGDIAFSAKLNNIHSSLSDLQFSSRFFSYENILLNDLSSIISVKDIFDHPNIELHSSIGKFIKQTYSLENIVLKTIVDPTQTQWPFTLAAQQDLNKFTIETQGNWHYQKNALDLTLDLCNGKIINLPYTLQQSVHLYVDADRFLVTPFTIALAEASLSGSINYKTPFIETDLQFENLPSSLLDFRSKGIPRFNGILSGSASINGTLAQPTGQLNLSISNARVQEGPYSKFPEVSGHFVFDIDEKGVKCSGNIIPKDYPVLSFESHSPITCSLIPLDIRIDKDGPINGRLNASGDLAILLQPLISNSMALSGKVETALHITGSINAPRISGEADVSEGSFESLDTGAVFTDLKAHFEATDSNIYLKELSAKEGLDGFLLGTGQLSLEAESKYQYHFGCEVRDAVLLNQEFVQAAFNGNLMLNGNAEGASLSGSLESRTAQLTVPEQSRSLHHVEVTYINASSDQKTFVKIPSPSRLQMGIDISLTFPENIIVRGRDLDSEWKGQLAITGTAESPYISGNFKVINGRYLFNGKEFFINQGSISIAGDPEKKTTLYVIASKDLGKVKVEVILKGSIKNPSISFRSNPPMSQREILSWILFNQGTSEISNFQGSQLTESITNLSDDHKGPDVLTKIRNALGIDRFDISRDENNESGFNVQLGKYISENVFVSINKSDVNRIAVEAGLMKNIKLQAQVGDDSEGQILLKWKRDY